MIGSNSHYFDGLNVNPINIFCIQLVICVLLLSSPTYSQESVEVYDRYREDQIYLGVSFLAIVRNQSDFFQRGVSSQFQFGIVRDIPISDDGRWAIGLGLGYSTSQFNSNLFRVSNPDSGFSYRLEAGVSPQNEMGYSFQSLEFPIELRWRNSSPLIYKFWRVYGGLKFLWNVTANFKQGNAKNSILDQVNRWSSEVFLNFGYNTWNFNLSYELSPVLGAVKLEQKEELLELRLFKIGLIFYLL